MGRQEGVVALLQHLEGAMDVEVLQGVDDRARFSRDYFDYSPVLIQQLGAVRADLVVRPHGLDGVERVVRSCAQLGLPLTLRGAGSGNYGQCVPLEGGVVMLTSALRTIRDIDSATGVVTVEPGCSMRDLDQALRSHGRELRLLPSTWRSASIGGFIAGGSGGGRYEGSTSTPANVSAPPPVSSVGPPVKTTSMAAAHQHEQDEGDRPLAQNVTPSLPEIDAGLMVSAYKIRTLGITV